MTKLFTRIPLILLLNIQFAVAQVNFNYVSAFRDTLMAISARSDNEFFKLHCQSIINVIDFESPLSQEETDYIKRAYEAYNNDNSLKEVSGYLERKHPFILAWESPIDGVTSLSIFHPPKDWDPSRKYPVYVQLHGMWDVAFNNINYMTWPFSQQSSGSYAFEDGYYLAPWGFRAGYDTETGVANIWEAINFLSEYVEIDTNRRFICGHSAGGYGAMYIALCNIDKWAGVGIHAGYFEFSALEEDVLNVLHHLPIYFVIGTNDGAEAVKERCYDFLYDHGHRNIEFVTFEGGHEYRQEDVERMYLWMKQQGTAASIQESSAFSADFICYPNPFKATAQIRYSLATAKHIQIEVFNNLGQPVELIIHKTQKPGTYSENWTPENLPAGIYYLRVAINDNAVTSKLIYLK